MIEGAREKAREIGDVRFLAGDMLGIEELFPHDTEFDLIYCIGNSLVHLADEEQVAAFIMAARALMASNGAIVIQIVCFDNLLRKGVEALPDLKSEDGRVLFRRRYEYQPDNRTVRFRSALSISGNEVVENSVPLLILTRKNLETIAAHAGLRDCRFYGSFEEDPVDRDSFPLILAAVK
jgi:SAM-dependent methyltransferase